jgi:hypothetical protein
LTELQLLFQGVSSLLAPENPYSKSTRIMATNGEIVDEPHKIFDTILTLDFGSVTRSARVETKKACQF